MEVPSEGSVVSSRFLNSEKWKLGRVEGQLKGRDGVLRGFKVTMENGYLIKRTVQLVADLEISVPLQQQDTDLNPDAPEFLLSWKGS